jgi:hypothetical protein
MGGTQPEGGSSGEGKEARHERRLPEIGERPSPSFRRRRWLKVGMAVTGVLFACGSSTIAYLQKHEPGPSYHYVPSTPITLSSLAIDKGFPKDCLYDPIMVAFRQKVITGSAPPVDPLLTDPNQEVLACEYIGHADGQPAPDPSGATCKILLRRYLADPYDFFATVTDAAGQPQSWDRNPTFQDVATASDLPPLCAPTNMIFLPH